jgi:hypothetical protein
MSDYVKKEKTRSARPRPSKASSTNAAARPTGTINDFIGILAGKTKKVATLEEIKEAIERGWAGQVRVGRKWRSRG